MRADVDHLRLFVERRPDHWAVGILNRVSGAWLYRAQCTSELGGKGLVIDFVRSELGRAVAETDLIWTDVALE